MRGLRFFSNSPLNGEFCLQNQLLIYIPEERKIKEKKEEGKNQEKVGTNSNVK